MRRKEANRRAAQPPRAIERTDKLPTPPTTRATPPQVSDHSPRSGAPHQAKRRPKPSAPRWALSWGIRRAPKGGLATGQPKCNDRATRCETPLLERPRPVSAQRPRRGDVASALGAAPRRERRGQPPNRRHGDRVSPDTEPGACSRHAESARQRRAHGAPPRRRTINLFSSVGRWQPGANVDLARV